MAGVSGCAEGNVDPSTANGGTDSATAGSAGSSANGGSSAAGSGGSAGNATGGNGGAPAVTPIRTFDFAGDTEGWQFVYAEPATLIAAPAVPGDAGADAGQPPAQAGVARATHDPDDGAPPGSVRLELPFTDGPQKISYEVNVAEGAQGIDFSGRPIRVQIKVDEGLTTDPTYPAGVKIYVKTGASSFYADSGFLNIEDNADWQTFTWQNVDVPVYPSPPGDHNPADVRQVGIEFATGDCGNAATGCPDNIYTPAILHMDTLQF